MFTLSFVCVLCVCVCVYIYICICAGTVLSSPEADIKYLFDSSKKPSKLRSKSDKSKRSSKSSRDHGKKKNPFAILMPISTSHFGDFYKLYDKFFHYLGEMIIFSHVGG